MRKKRLPQREQGRRQDAVSWGVGTKEFTTQDIVRKNHAGQAASTEVAEKRRNPNARRDAEERREDRFQERSLRCATRRAKNARKRKPGRSGRDDKFSALSSRRKE